MCIIEMLRIMELRLETLMSEIKLIKADKSLAGLFKEAQHKCMMKKWEEVTL
jgi:hypothetical protein